MADPLEDNVEANPDLENEQNQEMLQQMAEGENGEIAVELAAEVIEPPVVAIDAAVGDDAPMQPRPEDPPGPSHRDNPVRQGALPTVSEEDNTAGQPQRRYPLRDTEQRRQRTGQALSPREVASSTQVGAPPPPTLAAQATLTAQNTVSSSAMPPLVAQSTSSRQSIYPQNQYQYPPNPYHTPVVGMYPPGYDLAAHAAGMSLGGAVQYPPISSFAQPPSYGQAAINFGPTATVPERRSASQAEQAQLAQAQQSTAQAFQSVARVLSNLENPQFAPSTVASEIASRYAMGQDDRGRATDSAQYQDDTILDQSAYMTNQQPNVDNNVHFVDHYMQLNAELARLYQQMQSVSQQTLAVAITCTKRGR